MSRIRDFFAVYAKTYRLRENFHVYVIFYVTYVNYLRYVKVEITSYQALSAVKTQQLLVHRGIAMAATILKVQHHI